MNINIATWGRLMKRAIPPSCSGPETYSPRSVGVRASPVRHHSQEVEEPEREATPRRWNVLFFYCLNVASWPATGRATTPICSTRRHRPAAFSAKRSGQCFGVFWRYAPINNQFSILLLVATLQIFNPRLASLHLFLVMGASFLSYEVDKKHVFNINSTV